MSDTALAPPAEFKANRHRPVADRIFTCGQAARFCGVAPRTVAKWLAAGKIKGLRLPGSLDRRFYGRDVVAFILTAGMRLPAALADATAVVVYGLSGDPLPAGVLVAADDMAFGVLVGSESLAVAILGDDNGLAAALKAAALVRSRHPGARIYFALSPDVSPSVVAEAGYADAVVLARPLVRETVPQLLAVAG